MQNSTICIFTDVTRQSLTAVSMLSQKSFAEELLQADIFVAAVPENPIYDGIHKPLIIQRQIYTTSGNTTWFCV